MSQSHFNYLSSTLSGKVASYCFDLFIFFFPITCKHSYAFRLFNTFQVSAMFEVPHCACECFEIFYRNSSNKKRGASECRRMLDHVDMNLQYFSVIINSLDLFQVITKLCHITFISEIIGKCNTVNLSPKFSLQYIRSRLQDVNKTCLLS